VKVLNDILCFTQHCHTQRTDLPSGLKRICSAHSFSINYIHCFNTYTITDSIESWIRNTIIKQQNEIFSENCVRLNILFIDQKDLHLCIIHYYTYISKNKYKNIYNNTYE